MEGTVVATGMPTIVGQLGGLSIYSWVFSIYMLTSTTTVPIYGKLSDIYGRKRIYIISMLLFVAGSILCGQAHSMEQLILFRAVQGLGAGGVLPLAFTIIGELFTLEQRAKMQGLLSGVWGVSAVIGPLIGGFLVDQISWQWIFYINILPGLLAVIVIWFAWKETAHPAATKQPVDYWGAAFLTLGVLCLLMGLNELGNPVSLGYLVASAGLFAGLFWAERRAVDPILPFSLFRDRLFTVAILHGVFAGWAMFGSISYIPLFVQAVLGTSATQAGIALTPQSLAWTLTSIVGAPLLLKISHRTLALVGMVLLSAGALLMAFITPASSQIDVMIYTSMMGAGMGFCIPAFLIAVQSTVRKDQLGVATSTVQFSRSIGGTLGVSVMGAFLSNQLAKNLAAAGMDPSSVSLDSLLDPIASASASLGGPLRLALSGAISNLFWIAFAAAFLGLIVAFFTPGGKISQTADVALSEIPAECEE